MKRALRLQPDGPVMLTPGQVVFLSRLADDAAREALVDRATAHRASRLKKRDWEKFLKGE